PRAIKKKIAKNSQRQFSFCILLSWIGIFPPEPPPPPLPSPSPPVAKPLLDPLSSLPAAPPKWKLARWLQLVPVIGALEPELQAQSDEELRKRSLALRYRAKSREPLTQLMPEAYALVREAGRRKLNMRHFDVQLLGGIALPHPTIAEIQTSERKTL